MADAKVVDGDEKTEFLVVVDDRAHVFGIVDLFLLGEFEHDAVQGKAIFPGRIKSGSNA